MKLEHMQKSIEINGREYNLIKFGAEKSWGFVHQITSMLDLDKSGAGDLGSLAIKLLGHKDGIKLIKDLTSSVSCKATKINFDEHFSEFPQDLLPVVGFSLAENVIPFFGADSLLSLTTTIEKAMSSSVNS